MPPDPVFRPTRHSRDQPWSSAHARTTLGADFSRRIVAAAAEPYRPAGRFAWHFARGKLARDPLFSGLLENGLVPDGAHLLDLGCGQGLLAAWLFSARELFEAGHWPSAWPPPPKLAGYRGIELISSDVRRASRALGDRADFILGDLRRVELGRGDVIVIFDVLHYLDYSAQDRLLMQVRDRLRSGGRLLLRVGDAAGGFPFRFSTWVDHVVTFARGHRLSKLYCRSLQDWKDVLADAGFKTESIPMSAGTPFANVLLVATLESRVEAEVFRDAPRGPENSLAQ